MREFQSNFGEIKNIVLESSGKIQGISLVKEAGHPVKLLDSLNFFVCRTDFEENITIFLEESTAPDHVKR